MTDPFAARIRSMLAIIGLTILAVVPGAAEGKAPLSRIRTVAAVAEPRLARALEPELKRWMRDLEAEGYAVRQVELPPGANYKDLRELLAREYRESGIEGALLLGNLPLAWYENEPEGSYPYLLDYYFEELTGTWSDEDGDGWLDGHVDPDHNPEIYIGRLRADNSGSPEVPALKAYFDRNHAYRRGLSLPPIQAAMLSPEGHPAKNYRAETLFGPKATLRPTAPISGRDFLSLLAQEKGEVLNVVAHSTETGMRWLEPDSWVSSMALRAVQKGYRFVILHDCGAGDLSVNANLASAFLYANTEALAVVTVLKAAGTGYFDGYFLSDRLRTEPCLGRALLEHKRIWASDDVETSDEAEFHILGDPSLRLSTAFRPDYAPYEAAAEPGWKVFDNGYSYSLEELIRLGAYYDIRYFKLDSGSGGGSPWGRYQNRSFGDLNGDIHATKGQGASVEFMFYGDAVEFYSETSADHGGFDAFIDGRPMGKVALTAPRKGQALVFSASWPENGAHVLRLVSDDPSKWAVVDFFRAHVR